VSLFVELIPWLDDEEATEDDDKEEEEEELEEVDEDSTEARYQVKLGHGCACVEQGNSTVSPDWATMWRIVAIIFGGIRDCGSRLRDKKNTSKFGSDNHK